MLSRSLFRQALPRAVASARPSLPYASSRLGQRAAALDKTFLTLQRSSFSTASTMAQAASGPPDFNNYSDEKWAEGVHNIVKYAQDPLLPPNKAMTDSLRDIARTCGTQL